MEPPGRKRRVVHVLKEPYDVYIGDAVPKVDLPRSKWRNPYLVSPAGPFTPKESLRLYEMHIRDSPTLMQAVGELRGKVLGCWCKTPDKPDALCHGDILIKIVNELEEIDEWSAVTDGLI